jgi:hypothetical protein
MQPLLQAPVVAALPHWTSPRTFGDPQGVMLVVLLVLLALFAVMAIYTLVRELAPRRRGRGA